MNKQNIGLIISLLVILECIFFISIGNPLIPNLAIMLSTTILYIILHNQYE